MIHCRAAGGPKPRIWRKKHSPCPAGEEIGSVTADGAYDATRRLPPVVPTLLSRPAKMPLPGSQRARARRHETKSCAHQSIPAAPSGGVERISPPEPGRVKDELHQAARPIPDGKRLRTPGRRALSSHRRSERLHRSRYTCHRARRVNPSGESGAALRPGFAQQRRGCSSAIGHGELAAIPHPEFFLPGLLDLFHACQSHLHFYNLQVSECCQSFH